MAQKVVAHFIDHSVVKGTSVDVDAARPYCHVHTPEGQTVEVDLTQVKALFIVKDFDGQPEYDETHVPESGDARLRGSHQVHVTFRDGERLGALMNRYPPNRPFYFVLPMDGASNNVRILVNGDAVASIEPAGGQAPRGPSTPKARPDRLHRSSWVFDGKDIRQVETDR